MQGPDKSRNRKLVSVSIVLDVIKELHWKAVLRRGPTHRNFRRIELCRQSGVIPRLRPFRPIVIPQCGSPEEPVKKAEALRKWFDDNPRSV